MVKMHMLPENKKASRNILQSARWYVVNNTYINDQNCIFLDISQILGYNMVSI